MLGPKRLPSLGRALGQGIREFRGALSEGEAGHGPSHPVAAEPDGSSAAPVAGPGAGTVQAAEPAQPAPAPAPPAQQPQGGQPEGQGVHAPAPEGS